MEICLNAPVPLFEIKNKVLKMKRAAQPRAVTACGPGSEIVARRFLVSRGAGENGPLFAATVQRDGVASMGDSGRYFANIPL